MKDIALVVGSGSWGTALAQVLSDNGTEVYIYGINEEEVNYLNTKHRNSKFFEDVDINVDIKAYSSYDKLFNEDKITPNIIILAVPSNALNAALNALKSYITFPCILINVIKGFVNNNSSISSSIREIFPNSITHPLFSLLGPSHAEEVIRRSLTFVNLYPLEKTNSEQLNNYVKSIFSNPYFKVILQEDLIDAELCVAFKNMVALMSGILSGLGYKDNARAALFSIGLTDMYNLISTLNPDYKIETILGLAGAGDLAVTCYSNNSRNFQAGKLIGQLNSYHDFIKVNQTTVEGLNAVKYFNNLLVNYTLDLKILNCLNMILNDCLPAIAVNVLITKYVLNT